MLLLLSKEIFCFKYPNFFPLALYISPESGSKFSVIMLNKVVFPAPLSPINPIFSLSCIVNEIFSITFSTIYAFEMLLHDKTIITKSFLISNLLYSRIYHKNSIL